MLLRVRVKDGRRQMLMAQQLLHITTSFYCALNISEAMIYLCPDNQFYIITIMI